MIRSEAADCQSDDLSTGRRVEQREFCAPRAWSGRPAWRGDHTDRACLGLTAGRETQGHRFEARMKSIILKDADSYAQQLENEGAVIASFAARRAEIVRQLKLSLPEKP